MKRLVRVMVASLLVLPAASSQGTTPWPELASVDVAVGMQWNADKLYLSVPLRDVGGTIQYRLICRGGSEAYLDALLDRIGINYVGPLMCILNEGDREAESSLLRETDVPPWFTRGRFTHENLVGTCANHPEFGRVRNFRLRGFILTLEIVDPEIDEERIRHAVLRISVRPDPTAVSAIASPSDYAESSPNRDGCKT